MRMNTEKVKRTKAKGKTTAEKVKSKKAKVKSKKNRGLTLMDAEKRSITN